MAVFEALQVRVAATHARARARLSCLRCGAQLAQGLLVPVTCRPPLLPQELKRDNERLRLAAASAREAAARHEAEQTRLARENARLAAALVRLCVDARACTQKPLRAVAGRMGDELPSMVLLHARTSSC